MELTQYYISFPDHICEPASEGFFMDDKKPNVQNKDVFGTGVIEVIKYKDVQLQVPGNKWAEVFINSHPNISEGFKRTGLQDLETFVSEITAAEQFVKANGDKYREAVSVNNIEVMNNLADGLRNCLPKLRQMNQAYNRGNHPYNGSVIPMDDAFKKKATQLLTEFQRVYRDVAVLLAKNYIDQHASKSTLKKIFKHTEKGYSTNHYLEKELYAYCKDIHLNIQDGFYN